MATILQGNGYYASFVNVKASQCQIYFVREYSRYINMIAIYLVYPRFYFVEIYNLEQS